MQTELGAVNEMLRAISSSPVNRIDGADIGQDAASARDMLRNLVEEFQDSAEDWFFNSETFDLQPDASTGVVKLPIKYLKAWPQDPRYVARGDRLYDTQEHTDAIGRAVKCRIRLLLPYDSMPNAGRAYVAQKAKRLFRDRELGESNRSSPDEDELRAYATILNDHCEAVQANVINGRSVRRYPGFD
jgi:hypothetical protein